MWYKNPTAILSVIAGIGIGSTAIVKSAVYITLPDRVQASEEKVDTIEDYIKSQQLTNDLLQKIVTKEENKEIIISPDGKKFWNEETQKWELIKK